MNSIPERLSRAELDLGALHQEAQRLDITFRELRNLFEKERPVKVEPFKEELPPPLPEEEQEIQTDIQPVIESKKIITTKIEAPDPLRTPVTPTKPVYSRELEMELGKVWSVRIGIVLLTTGLVFLSSYTYKNFIHDLGPGIRLTMLYLVCFFLTGAGLFCERWKESLQNYGRVVAAGGLAAIYYTSYAAHNVEPLKIIESPVLGSLLLLLSAGLCGVVSLWRNSRLMMGVSLSLAFYSVLLNPLGWMVALSALVLSAGACWIGRVRNWPELAFISLSGSYLSAGWWELHTSSGATMPLFLIVFWALFLAVSFVQPKLPEHHLFAGTNHSLFFLIFSLDLQTRTWMEHHWVFCIIFGAVLIGIGLIARKRFSKTTVILHLTKGLGLITLGFILKLSGHQLFMTLLLQAVVLTGIHLRLKSQFSLIASWVIAGLSALLMLEMTQSVPTVAWAITTILWTIYAILQRRCDSDLPNEKEHPVGLAGFCVTFLCLTFGVMHGMDHQRLCLIIGSLGLATLALEKYKISLRDFRDAYWVSTGFATGAMAYLIADSQSAGILLVGAVMTMALSIGHRQLIAGPDDQRNLRKGLAAGHFVLGLLFIGFSIHEANFSNAVKMLLFLTLPIAGTMLASKTKELLHSLGFFALALGAIAHAHFSAGPLFIGFLIVAGHHLLIRFSHKLPDAQALGKTTFVMASVLLYFGLANSHLLGDHILLFMSFAGAGLILLGRFYSRRLVSTCAAPFLLTGIGLAILQEHSAILYLGLLPLLLIHLYAAHRDAGVKHRLVGCLVLLVLWLAITRDLGDSGRAASWAVLGTIALLIGLAAKSRIFRLTALAILGATLGHVMMIDIVKLDPLPRILSFITLGIGLLGLGFVYNQWGEKLKQIL